MKDLLVGSEGTLGIVTAVRLRLLPAPEVALPVVAFMASEEEGCEALLGVMAAGIRPSVLDFLDGSTLGIAGPAYPGEVPSQARFGLLIELDGRAEEVRAQRADLDGVLAGTALAIDEPADKEAVWRWRDGVNPAVTGARGAKVSGDVVVPVEMLRSCLERFAGIAAEHGLGSCAWGHGGEGNVHATVLVDPSSRQELDAAEEVMEALYATVAELGGSIAGEHGVGLLKKGRLALQWSPRAVELHEQVKALFDPKGLLNPGKKLARAGAGAGGPG